MKKNRLPFPLCFSVLCVFFDWFAYTKMVQETESNQFFFISFVLYIHAQLSFSLMRVFFKTLFSFFFFTFQFNWFVRNIFFLFVIVPPRWSSVIVKPPEYEMDFLVLTHTLIGSLNINLFRSVSIFLFVFFLFYPFVALLCFISIYFLRFSSLFLPTSLWSYASFSQDEKQ